MQAPFFRALDALQVDGAAALTEAAKQYTEEHADDPPDGGLKFIDISEEGFAKARQTASWRWHSAIMRYKADIAYCFIRAICNGHPPKAAAQLLFQRQHGGPGSGWLADYIGDLLPKD